jgi:uridylate kinase
MSHTPKRLLVKLSGEQLAGQHEGGVDTKLMSWVANELTQAADSGAQIVVVVGGGNFARGKQLQSDVITRTTADNVGLLSTLLNALILGDVFNASGLPTRVLSSVAAEQVVDTFTYRRAINHLQKGRVVVVAGGIGRPYFTTDTGSVNLALELDCDVVCKTTKVDGVYDRDPEKFADAKRIDRMSFQQAVADGAIRVMDKAALGLAMEEHKPILVFDLMTEGNIRRAALGEPVGTLIQ